MDTLEFLVQGSSPVPYRVVFRRRDGGHLSAYCTCAAGESGMYCKHRVHIMRGSVEGIVSENHGDVTTVTQWLDGTDVEVALRTVVGLEFEAERIKKDLSAAKKILSRAFTRLTCQ
jgi:uncharacterized Zn finger protein